MKVSYNWLQTYFEQKLPPVEKLAGDITFHLGEVEGLENTGKDTVLDVNILPNRAHDCLSHRGIAKEVAAILSSDIIDEKATHIKGESTKLTVKVESPKCRRYMGRVIRNIKVGESPDFLKDKLTSIGQRTINNLVDIGNFVLFDKGQPVHVFDLDKLTGEGIIVREGIDGENFTTLDGKNIDINSTMLVIADKKQVLGLAGIKGGNIAEVDENTKNIIVEVANFDPLSTRKTARKLGLLTDAGKRFENDLSPELCTEGMDTMTKLIVDCAKTPETIVEEAVDIYPHFNEPRSIQISVNTINSKLGFEYSPAQIEDVWERLGFQYKKNNEIFTIIPSPLRLDLVGPHDLVEEVGRTVGYGEIDGILPKINFTPKINETFYKILATRKLLLDRGYNEVMTYTLSKKGEREVARGPKGKSFLRTNISDGLHESLKLNSLNAPLLRFKEIKIFEIGTVFSKDVEEMNVAYTSGKDVKELSLDEFCKQEDITIGNSYESLISPVENKKFIPWSVYPFIVRDISVWMNEKYDEKALQIAIEEVLPKDLLACPIHVIDTFEKDGKTSKTFRIIFQSSLKTLTDFELEEPISTVNNKIANLGLKIR